MWLSFNPAFYRQNTLRSSTIFKNISLQNFVNVIAMTNTNKTSKKKKGKRKKEQQQQKQAIKMSINKRLCKLITEEPH